jgi:ABC-2 type transport system ATP-binding protein
MTGGDAILSVRDLTKRYGAGRFRTGFTALRGVSLEVGRGSVFGLLGPNGAGKTTLLKVLLGLGRFQQGEAHLFGQPVGDAAARKKVGYLPENHRLPGYLTGRQALRLFAMMCGRPRRWVDERLDRWLDRVGMRSAANKKLREYSKGMQQRLGLAQALIHEPELVFLDEPTDGVDPVGRREIRKIIAELRDQGVTLFLNSHLLLEVERMCNRVVILHQGEIIREGTIEELTPHTGMVRMELERVPDDLAQLLEGVGGTPAVVDSAPNEFEIAVSGDELDGVIDRLRGHGLSIRSISPRRLSLEDSFIDLIREDRR